MQDNEQEMLEALEMAVDYIPKLYNGIQKVCVELTEERYEDTDEFLGKIVQGINWIIEVFNATREVINESEQYIHKDKVNQSVLRLNDALMEKDDHMIAEILSEEFVPFLQNMEMICRQRVGAN